MRRLLLALLCCLPLLALAACSSDNFYRGTVEGDGKASARAVQVKDGVEQPITNTYTVTGQYRATAQSIKPYLTLDGDWAATASAREDEPHAEPGAVLIRPLPPGDASDGRHVILDGKPCYAVPEAPCANGVCSLPGAGQSKVVAAPPVVPAPCAPPAVAPPPLPEAAAPALPSDCGRPVYKGCDGTPGGNRPTPYGDLGAAIPPGSGWPCPRTPPGQAILSAAAVPPAFLVHVGECFVGFMRCVFSF